MQVIKTKQALREWSQSQQCRGEAIALVPTMGALHEGHVSLVEQARQRASRIVVSIFVNPTQFGPNEDFECYPRMLDTDIAALTQAGGVDAVYAPSSDQMYPSGFATTVQVRGLSEGLCAGTRPGHFNGVATVVSKLLLQSQANFAVFGEKDYQQLRVIRQMVDDLDIGTEVIGAPICRESDGLARSSRNRYLSSAQRLIAPKLYQRLQGAAAAIAIKGKDSDVVLRQSEVTLKGDGFDAVEYIELRDAQTLQSVTQLSCPARLLVAVRLGTTRLIDNISLDSPISR